MINLVSPAELRALLRTVFSKARAPNLRPMAYTCRRCVRLSFLNQLAKQAKGKSSGAAHDRYSVAMLAMVLERPRGLLVATERAVPTPGASAVRVRVTACAVCRTDLHAAPLLCAGFIGYRSPRRTGDAHRIGLHRFAAANAAIAALRAGNFVGAAVLQPGRA
jgi:hypothetical protein